ncbi:MAG TPA: Maf family protein [Stellaceae bacterium]|nr:Maf family protein [Stellaceae bacterium]
MRLVLASESGARKRLLAAAGVEFATDPAGYDEAAAKRTSRARGEDAAQCALALATAKARAVAARHADAIVIGADQMLDCDAAWLDKPADLAAARAQLLELRGKTHALVTAAVAVERDELLWRHVATARLVMRPFSDAFLERYLALMGARVLATVGGYELEGLGAQLFAKIEGDYFAILGLPLLPLLAFLRAHGALPA